MDNRQKLKWIGINIYSSERCIGKTTIAMQIIKDLRSLGYDVRYEGHDNNHTMLIEEQIKRTIDNDLYILDGITIFVEDKK